MCVLRPKPPLSCSRGFEGWVHIHTEGRLESWYFGRSPRHLAFPQHHWLGPSFLPESCLPWAPRGPREEEGRWQSLFLSLCLVLFPPSPASAPPSVVDASSSLPALLARVMGGHLFVSRHSRGETGLKVWGWIRLLKPHHCPVPRKAERTELGRQGAGEPRGTDCLSCLH